MSDHCPACRVLRELTEHRDNAHADWSLRRGTLNFARVIAARACPNYAPKPTETEETPVRDHDTCEEAINAALASGNDGRAEFLAARCDTHHGELAAPTRTHVPDPDGSAARARSAVAVGEQESTEESNDE